MSGVQAVYNLNDRPIRERLICAIENSSKLLEMIRANREGQQKALCAYSTLESNHSF